MSLGYLLASLPMLFPDRPPAITAEAFRAACSAALGAADAAAAEALLDGRTEDSGHPAVRAWRELDAAVAGAVGRRRLALRGNAAGALAFEPPETGACPLWLMRAVDDAFAAAVDPLAREDALMRVRWAAAESLAGPDPLSRGRLFAYAVQLRLALRRAALSSETGAARLEAALPKETL